MDQIKGELFSVRHTAELAGLGRIGRNTLLITSQYGPRVRIGALIKEAPIAPDLMLDDTVCLPKCRLSIETCPAEAISEKGYLNHINCFLENETRYDFNKTRLEDLRKVMKGDRTALEARAVSAADYVGRSCGIHCLKVCPIGKKNTSMGN
jgi:epoxyqueuosine reductase QueG